MIKIIYFHLKFQLHPENINLYVYQKQDLIEYK